MKEGFSAEGLGEVENIDGAEISVVNWDLYNPRTDSKRPIWFRLENTIATGPGFFGLDCEQKWLWVFILSLVSQKNGQSIVWDCAFCYSLTKIRPQKQSQTIGTFEKFGRLRVSREVTSQVSAEFTHYGRTDERTNETNGRDETNPAESARADLLSESTQDVLDHVKRELQDSWVTTYGDVAWIKQEIAKAATWLQANPDRRKKHLGRFMTNWLSRGWEDKKAGRRGPVSRTEHNQASLQEYLASLEAREGA